MNKNRLYFGDNLDIMKSLATEYPKGFVDLCYIDPPFNSKRNYNILFEGLETKGAKAQKQVFADTWSNQTYWDALHEVQDLNLKVFKLLHSLQNIISTGAVSYLTTMALRIHYIHKLLKPTGSFYLHCDPTMSHYLKIVCDLVFGENNFRNEIVWKRKTGRGETNHKSNKFGNSTDTILFYAKSKKSLFNPQFNKDALGYQDYVKKFFRYKDEEGRIYRIADLSSPSLRPNLIYSYKGYKPPKNGWAISKETMKKFENEGRLHFPKSKNGRIQRKRFLSELKGKPTQNLWDDIQMISSQASERLGYPTQKPEKLLERIIKASSNEGDVVADFFCGCGTTIAVAQRLGRKWVGVDISHLATGLIKKRLISAYGKDVKDSFEVFGTPKDIASAKELAAATKGGRFKFEEWIVEFILGGVLNETKNKTGFDGYMTFVDHQKTKNLVLIEVKSGGANVTQLNHFIQTTKKQKADMGLFVCFAQQITRGMLEAAKSQGYWKQIAPYDKIQVVAVEDLLEENFPNIPDSQIGTFKSAERMKSIDSEQSNIVLD